MYTRLYVYYAELGLQVDERAKATILDSRVEDCYSGARQFFLKKAKIPGISLYMVNI
jgi:hypothetical protein